MLATALKSKSSSWAIGKKRGGQPAGKNTDLQVKEANIEIKTLKPWHAKLF